MTNKAVDEAKPTEVFVGNASYESGTKVCIPEYLTGLTTVRLGLQAYGIDGSKLNRDRYRPIFIGRSEVAAYDRIMMAKTFPNQRVW